MLISGLLKLTPLPCLLSLQTFHLIAITTELWRRDPAPCYRLSVSGGNPKLRCVNCCFRDSLGTAEPVQSGYALPMTCGDFLLFLSKDIVCIILQIWAGSLNLKKKTKQKTWSKGCWNWRQLCLGLSPNPYKCSFCKKRVGDFLYLFPLCILAFPLMFLFSFTSYWFLSCLLFTASSLIMSGILYWNAVLFSAFTTLNKEQALLFSVKVAASWLVSVGV